MPGTMWYRAIGVLALIGLAILMALRGELSSIVTRSLVAAIAGSLGTIAWICIVKSRADRNRRDHS